MKDFRHTLIDRKLFYPIHRPHLVSTARRWKSFHSLTHQIILFLLFCTNSFRINKIHSFIHMILFTEKKPPLKTFEDVQALLSQGKKREVKLLLRDNAWPINSTIRAQLWPTICSQHQVGKSMLEGYYWDMVNQVWDCIIINKLRTLSNKLYLNQFDSWNQILNIYFHWIIKSGMFIQKWRIVIESLAVISTQSIPKLIWSLNKLSLVKSNISWLESNCSAFTWFRVDWLDSF